MVSADQSGGAEDPSPSYLLIPPHLRASCRTTFSDSIFVLFGYTNKSEGRRHSISGELGQSADLPGANAFMALCLSAVYTRISLALISPSLVTRYLSAVGSWLQSSVTAWHSRIHLLEDIPQSDNSSINTNKMQMLDATVNRH